MFITLPRLLVVSPLALLASAVLANPITLKEQSSHITIHPESLNIDWNGLIVNSPALKVNKQQQTASDVQVNVNQTASWVLQPSGIKVTAQLKNDVLAFAFSASHLKPIKRNQPTSLEWFNLPEKQSDTLFLPFSEGMRVPIQNKTWAKFLTNSYSGSNTTQDLKMPFWTVQQGKRFVSYQLVTPTNNRLEFSNATSRLDMSASHQFTVLSQPASFRIRITLGDNPLDGAKQYRQWRIDNGMAEPLIEKQKRNPDIAKLIGASHVYLFGTGLLSVEDVTDWWGLKKWYLTQSGLEIPKDDAKALSSLQRGKNWFSQYHKQLLLDALESSLKKRFDTPFPTLADNTIARQYQAAQQRKVWLKTNAARYLISPEKWGQALSDDMLTTFHQAGLDKLWLGFDNWMPAFYQPQIVEKAKLAGYLVGTYDSYNTAIPAWVNDGWLTALLPNEMRKECAIELENGDKKKGFRNNGYYLNPNCHLEYVQKRIADIIKFGRFNSLFLDVDATAMAREDYRENTSETKMLNSFNQRMAWISDQKVVLGSESGNSLTTQGVAFAHGLESIGFGWRDQDMHKNRESPYYLGRWYPDHKPEFFFKTAKVKAPFKSLLFDPQYRVPLYQTVFHDEVINNHHWHTDSLKFSDVQANRDLTAMLYNTPPMVHLTRDEASSVSGKRIQALKHYQSAFQPIHEQVWDQPLVDFTWLNTKGDVQKTTFGDGSTIIANFSGQPFQSDGATVKPRSILAKLSNGKIIHWQSTKQ
ncbi:conserved hypothetical protein [Vibrio nigripulchritudo SOn1]|uniref:Glycosyl hydrolase n=1 Tax=Vibrio nigripulchritudo SOn1 TaxID=1238450 RepID=A0AAV2VPS2_9VIBR|nr:glycoside hydrolase [Vibrio nigripulchritudo]CCO46392.1 conserved hypothetical protein [Vibrio nigripulchritudo SOn1]